MPPPYCLSAVLLDTYLDRMTSSMLFMLLVLSRAMEMFLSLSLCSFIFDRGIISFLSSPPKPRVDWYIWLAEGVLNFSF